MKKLITSIQIKLFLLCWILMMLAVIAVWFSAKRSVDSQKQVVHTYQVLVQVRSVLVNVLSMETGVRGFAITGDETFLEPYRVGVTNVQNKLAVSRQLTMDNPAEQIRLAKLETLVRGLINGCNAIIEQRRANNYSGSIPTSVVLKQKQTLDEIRGLTREIASEEEQLLEKRADSQIKLMKMTIAAGIIAGLLVFGVGILAVVLGKHEMAMRQKAEAERKAFFDLAPDMLCIAGTDGYFKQVNSSFQKTLGWSEKEMLAHPFLDYVHPDDRAATVAAMEKLSRGEPIIDFENRYKCKDGSWKLLAWRSVPYPDGTIIATARDVTLEREAHMAELKQQEQTAVFMGVQLELRNNMNIEASEFFKLATKLPAEALGVERCSIWVFDDSGSCIRCENVFVRSSGTYMRGEKIMVADYPRYFAAVSRRDPIVADKAGTHPATSELRSGYLEPLGIQSMLDVPIVAGSRQLGILCLEHTGSERHWTPEEVKFAIGVANCLGIAFGEWERNRAQTILAENKELMEAVLNSIMAGVAVVDSDGKIIVVNKQWEKFAKENGASATIQGLGVGANYLEECARNAKALGMESQELLDGIRAVLERKRPMFRFEYAFNSHGEKRWFNMQVSSLARKHGGAVVVHFDITHRRRAEEQIRRLNTELEEIVAQRTSEIQQALATLDASDDAIFIFDAGTLRCIYVNEGAIRQLGYTREQLLGMTPAEYQVDCNEAKLREILSPMIGGQQRSIRITTSHRHRDGREIPVEVNLQYIAPAGERPRFIAIARDITERLKRDRIIMRTQRLESIGTLAAGVAHDLNNTLSPIMMGVQLLRTKYPDASQIVNMFDISARKGADLVRQLLTFAKGAEGERVSIPARRLIKDMETLITTTFPKNIRLEVELEQELPPVLGDATQLHQVLLNLCVNARDAMPNGGTLRLEVKRAVVDAAYAASVPGAKPGEYIVLRVSDTGTGMTQEVQDRIFEPFFTTKGPDKGTGIGLATVLGIVKGHGGFIQVYSKPGNGATFSVYLPVDKSETTAQTTAQAPAAEFSGKGETVMFVDDELAVRTIALIILQQANINPLMGADGTDGIMLAAQHAHELRGVITDLHMPNLDGIGCIRAIRRMLPNIPIVATSGNLLDAEIEELKSLGVTKILKKPFTSNQLLEIVRYLLAG